MANFNFNKVIFGGRLTDNAELKSTSGGKYFCKFSIAIKDVKGDTDFFNCTAFNHMAEFISRYFGKGSSICIVCHADTNEWTDNSGNKRKSVEFIVDEVTFVDSKNEEELW